MVATTVHLLRHGEVHNPEGILYGRLPGYRLSDAGARMAQVVADYLAGVQAGSAPGADPALEAGGVRRDVTVVIASPLQRAQETAAPLAKARASTAAARGRTRKDIVGYDRPGWAKFPGKSGLDTRNRLAGLCFFNNIRCRPRV